MRTQLLIVDLNICTIMVLSSESSFLSSSAFPTFPSIRFKVHGLMLMFLINLELRFVWGEIYGSSFIFYLWPSSLNGIICWWYYLFTHMYYWLPCQKSFVQHIWTFVYVFISIPWMNAPVFMSLSCFFFFFITTAL